MSRPLFALVFSLCLSVAWPFVAQAQRSLSFDAHALPEGGAVAIAVGEGLPEGEALRPSTRAAAVPCIARRRRKDSGARPIARWN
ncbi:hypothetical protein [Luteimonas saliphila]|uniref:hypothetical protein n=1 Tax=Luteimonas saliphila TaxID=2804919 RepID=UPI00192D6449|nr:hypothetical protein [Luteimonas saliphila]